MTRITAARDPRTRDGHPLTATTELRCRGEHKKREAVPEETKQPNPVVPDAEKPAAPAAAAVTTSAASETTPAAASPSRQGMPAAAGTVSSGRCHTCCPATERNLSAAAQPSPLPAAKPATPRRQTRAQAGRLLSRSPGIRTWSQRLSSQYGSGIREASTYRRPEISRRRQHHRLRNSAAHARRTSSSTTASTSPPCTIPSAKRNSTSSTFCTRSITTSAYAIKTQIKDGEHLRSAFGIWQTANWLEREVFDMFGIVVRRTSRPEAHPDAG